MKTNQLRIVPHVVKPDTKREFYAPAEGFVLWKIWVDDELLTETSRPFQDADSILELKTYIQIPIWIDGAWYVSVRKIGDYVLWHSNLEFDKYYYTHWDIGDTTYLFDAQQYETECKNAQIESEKLNLSLPDIGGKSYQSTQNLNNEELRFLLNLKFPEICVAIYREPTNPSNTTGAIILRRMQLAIQQLTDFTICDPPEKQIELRIGLDEAEFTEAIWHIGKMNGKFAIFFEQRPHFPVWLQSPEFDKVLSKEPFAEEV